MIFFSVSEKKRKIHNWSSSKKDRKNVSQKVSKKDEVVIPLAFIRVLLFSHMANSTPVPRPSHQGLCPTKGEPCCFQQASFILALGRNEAEVDRRHQTILRYGTSQVTLVIKNPPANARDTRDMGSISGSERSPGGGHGNPLQYSYLENPHGQRNRGGCSL